MNKLMTLSIGLGYLISFDMAYAEAVNSEQSKTMISDTSVIVQARDGAIKKAALISETMMAESELKRIKTIAQADKDKAISDAEAIKLKKIAEVKAKEKAVIIMAKEKAKIDILNINKEVEAIRTNAKFTYTNKIKEAEEKLNPILVNEEDNKVFSEDMKKDIDTILKHNHINFILGTRNLTNKSIVRIKKIAQILKKIKDVHIEIAGYTDSDGSTILNKKLSLDRANKVKKILVQEGMNDKSMTTIGYGEKHPIVPNTTRANKTKNRRIEIKIIK